MVPSDQLLTAGALVPVKTKLQDRTGVDDLSARSYRHAALGDSPVVKLSADNLAAGDDLTMEFLGFDSPEVQSGVAKRRRQALGFPEWALVHDAKHARYALDLVKEFKKEARRARSKPGHAYEGFTNIASRLGKSVAHFLPSFWEQAGREFIAVGNTTYASRVFGKARDAESVHGLEIDEQIRQDAFLEFALAGCVSAKALASYGKELQAAHEPTSAWEFMRSLSVRRILGGMPPWAGMCRDLAVLIKPTGLDKNEELHDVLLEIMESPALSRAPMGFWKANAKLIAGLVKKNKHFAGVMLNLIPKTSSWRDDDIWQWLDYLEEWGILENAWSDSVSDAAGPVGGPSAWLSRLINCRTTPRQRLHDLVESMADRLRSDETAVELFGVHRWGHHGTVDVDLLERMLALKAPINQPPNEIVFSLTAWAKNAAQESTARDRPYDPVNIAEDARFHKALRDAVGSAAGEPEFEKAAREKTALKECRREWLLGLVERQAVGGLPAMEQSLSELNSRTTPATFQEFSEAYEKLKQIDAVSSLTRTVRAGIIDEYGWPALEAVVERMSIPFSVQMKSVKGKARPVVYGSFPNAIVSDGLTAVVVQRDQIVFEAEIKLPQGGTLADLHFLDGELLVVSVVGHESRVFWNSNPDASETHWYYGRNRQGVTMDVPDGGTFTGRKVIHAGDRDPLGTGGISDEWFSDGTHFYRASESDDNGTLRIVDPKTGNEGRLSLPSFFEDYAEHDCWLRYAHMSLFTFGDLVADSPLGSVNGTVGFRLRMRASGAAEGERIDGKSVVLKDGIAFQGLLDQPGTSGCLPLSTYSRYMDAEMAILDPTGMFRIAEMTDAAGTYNRGQVAALPFHFFHFFRLRDREASERLRAVTDQDMQLLVDAALKDVDARQGEGLPSEGTDYPQLDNAIQTLLPSLKNARFHVGLRAVVIKFIALRRRRMAIVSKSDPAKAGPKQGVTINRADATIQSTMQKLSFRERGLGACEFQSIHNVACFFSGQTSQVTVPAVTCEFLHFWLGALPRSAWTLYWMQEHESDTEWRIFLTSLAESGLLDLTGGFRLFKASRKGDGSFEFPGKEGVSMELRGKVGSFVLNDSRFLVTREFSGYRFIEYSPTGRFENLEGLVVSTGSDETVPNVGWTSEQLMEFLKLAAKKEWTLPTVDYVAQLAMDMGLSCEEVALIWLGYPGMFSNYASNFMPKNLREGLKLKTKSVSAARVTLRALPESVREGLVAEMLDGPPEEYWGHRDRLASRLKAAWAQHRPNRIPLPVDLAQKVSLAIGHPLDRDEMLVALNEPKTSSLFSTTAKWKFSFTAHQTELQHDASQNVFNVPVLNTAAVCIPWLTYELPVGDTARYRMAEVHAALLKSLDNPDLLLDAGVRYFYDESATDTDAASNYVESAFGKLKTIDGLRLADDGTAVAVVVQWRIHLAVRPSKVKTKKDYERVRAQLALAADHRTPVIDVVALVRSTAFKRICDRIESTPVPEGQYEANPLLSAPKLVARVQRRFSISDNAAAYYLQLLTLHDPADRNVKTWNGWSPAALKKAAAELLEAELVLEAKRPRAGRKLFLPGGWEALKAPHLPLETWKMPLFQLTRDVSGRAVAPLPRIVPLEPVHTLFAKAWKRIEDGDVPQYEEVD